ncbi:hypothetical protein [Hyphomonas sp.]|jgi:hypothetical protein|uniref:hypothetical protein n=1 Tax=Hyphomonas sp. TaxID=87 RepID=UPI001D2972B2|nr:hypothetical protein [Hyphomonas sp.]
MTKLDPLLLAGAKSKGKRPWFLESPDTERLLNITMALAQEVGVMRERMDTIERLLARDGKVSPAAIDGFEPTKSEADARGLWMQEFISRILRVVQQDREAIAAGDELSSEDVANELAS